MAASRARLIADALEDRALAIAGALVEVLKALLGMAAVIAVSVLLGVLIVRVGRLLPEGEHRYRYLPGQEWTPPMSSQSRYDTYSSGAGGSVGSR